ncbi:hypothetical protein RND81_04G165200 [Saponaria officinalis]|uniref:DUF4378 domain-containing protein n=1 Tax=Saponaria officinalis TaxID=3572 RepID=A0AAW1LLZ2_SAPOF
MGKHIRRKQSYVRVEKEDPGCIWTIFRLMNHHPWHNVKKMLPYINHKPHKSSLTDEEIEFHNSEELEEDVMTNYSASVHSSPSRGGSGSRKRSIKARIKALLADKANKSGKVNTIQEHELLALKEACNNLGTPTLISFLNSNPKLSTTVNPVDESPKASKEEYVGVLDLFKVDRELFSQVLHNSPKKHRLVKSGSFPFTNNAAARNSLSVGRTPSKLEHKHTEVWPVSNQGLELRKAKSHNIARSSSLKESVDRYGHLIDTTSTNNNNKGIMNKNLSKSLKLTTENDFSKLSDQHGRRSFRERMFLPEVESDMPRASLDCFLNNLSSQGDEVRVVRLESPPTEIKSITPAESNTDVKGISSVDGDREESIQEIEIVELIEDRNCERNDGISANIEVDVDFHQDHTENVNVNILEDLLIGDDVQGPDAHPIQAGKYEIDSCDENLQYVKYVLDIIGFTTTNEQLEAWHSPNQPLDPALFDGIEVCCPFEPKPSSNKESALLTSTGRKILFDLINEALFDTHENSYAYYPKALTANCVVHPESGSRSRVVEQVWEFVREYIRWKPELDTELNKAMEHELSRHKSGWSNVQTDCELLGIDLEDWIFSELLDEIICC